eukprot:TRINITY_DN2736_c0_g1_i5.p1 TRINITY_DN2736_c0_g1~~TRINITY_DN2736_c0_g1_i5.p1  ORF type:complete len:365 (-),score=46.79 TRINITY_DN2736_c0_g1_i5:497-1591(-)
MALNFVDKNRLHHPYQTRATAKISLKRSAPELPERGKAKLQKTSTDKAAEKSLTEASSPKTVEKRVQDLPVVPPGVTDIDAGEAADVPELCAEYTALTYSYLRHLETKYAIRKDFLKNCHVSGKMRTVLLDWLIDVHLQFKLLQETLYMAIFIIDLYLQSPEGLNLKRSKLQLLGVTAMFTASKIEEIYAPELGDFVYITDNAYSAAEVRSMELSILRTLKFEFGRPLPLHFLRRYSKAGEVTLSEHTLAKYIIELAQLEYDLAHLAPSKIAASSLYLAILLHSKEPSSGLWDKALEYYSGYNRTSLSAAVGKLATVLANASSSKFQAVYKKYCQRKVMQVAKLTCVNHQVLDHLTEKYRNSHK